MRAYSSLHYFCASTICFVHAPLPFMLQSASQQSTDVLYHSIEMLGQPFCTELQPIGKSVCYRV